MTTYAERLAMLAGAPRKWLVTGVAGFIGSNLLEALLAAGQTVVGLDNFSTGKAANLEDVRQTVGPEPWRRFSFLEGDIQRLEDCRRACAGIELVLHQAALGSVPRSIADPLATNRSNIDGFLNMLVAARDAEVGRFVFAASSSAYGDHPALPKTEDCIGQALSPYAVTKYVNELYARVFYRVYGLQSIGLRYFNVFGPRQDPEGVYSAVIPLWVLALVKGLPAYINGDGETTRDFCYVKNAVQANLLAATTANPEALNEVYNVACGQRTTLNQVFRQIREIVRQAGPGRRESELQYRPFRDGDIRHSLADISKASRLLGYAPQYDLDRGLREAIPWYLDHWT